MSPTLTVEALLDQVITEADAVAMLNGLSLEQHIARYGRLSDPQPSASAGVDPPLQAALPGL